jgi:hypothetical protein
VKVTVSGCAASSADPPVIETMAQAGYRIAGRRKRDRAVAAVAAPAPAPGGVGVVAVPVAGA